MNSRTMFFASVTVALSTVAAGASSSSLQPGEQQPPAKRAVSLNISGELAKAYSMVFPTVPTSSFKGELVLQPIMCDPLEKISKTALDFNLSAAQPLGIDCVFRVILGAATVAEIVPAEKHPYVPNGEPVVEVRSGFAVCGGTRPAARGKRGRSGAPGTQYVVQRVDDSDDSKDVEYFYLLSGTEVRVDADVAGTVYAKVLNNRDFFLEVDNSGNITEKKLSDHPERLAFRDAAQNIVNACELPGGNLKVAAQFIQLVKIAENEKVKPKPKDGP